jgi:ABC-type methionine transport system ATPase subunit
MSGHVGTGKFCNLLYTLQLHISHFFFGSAILQLSGGEKQRVSIARVFLKEPSILSVPLAFTVSLPPHIWSSVSTHLIVLNLLSKTLCSTNSHMLLSFMDS